MALVHVKAQTGLERQGIINLANIFGAKVIDASEVGMTVEATGERMRVNALLRLLGSFGIDELVRAGTLAIARLPAAAAAVDGEGNSRF
jgi:acetolactate synthase-1/3 small subunit